MSNTISLYLQDHHVLWIPDDLIHPQRPDILEPTELTTYRSISRIRVSNPITAQSELTTQAGDTFIGTARRRLNTNVHSMRSNLVSNSTRTVPRIRIGHSERLMSGVRHTECVPTRSSVTRFIPQTPLNRRYDTSIDSLRRGGPRTMRGQIFRNRTISNNESREESLIIRNRAHDNEVFRQLIIPRPRRPVPNVEMTTYGDVFTMVLWTCRVIRGLLSNVEFLVYDTAEV